MAIKFNARHGLSVGNIPTDVIDTSGNITANTITVSGQINGPATLVIDPAAVGDNTGKVVIKGDLQIDGTTTTVNSTVLTVDDINIVLNDTATPTDILANGGGITLNGTTSKTLNWSNSTTAWTSSENFDLASGRSYLINGTSVLSSTTLGSGVITSSLTTVGTVTSGIWKSTIQVLGSSTGYTTITSANSTATNYTVTLPTATDTLVGKATTDVFTNKTFDTAGAGNVLKVNGTQLTAVTGTGNTVVLSTSPTITTSLIAGGTSFDLINTTATTVNFAKAAVTLSIAATSGTTTINNALSATSFNKVTITAPATGSTLTIADGKTLTASNTLTFTGTDSSSIAFGGGGTVVYTSNKLSALSATTSSELAGVISDETGSGALVFANAPTLTGNVVNTGTITIGPTTSANLTRFPNALIVSSQVASGIQQNESHNIGVVGEGVGSSVTLGTISGSNGASTITVTSTTGLLVGMNVVGTGVGSGALIQSIAGTTLTLTVVNSGAVSGTGTAYTYGIGVYGKGYTSTGARSGGVVGEGQVSTSSDVGSAIGVRGYANDIHAGGYNVGLYGDATNGASNYALYLNNGDIFSLNSKTWNLNTGTLSFSNGNISVSGSINKVTITAPATGSTLTIADGKTLTASNTLTFTGTDSSSVVFGTGGTVVYTSNKLSALSATTSSELAGVISDETGTGLLVFGTSPTITTSLVAGGASFDLINTTATTVNFAGAATTLAIGGTQTVSSTLNLFTNVTASAATKTINFGTGGATGSLTNINIGSAIGGGTTIINPATDTSTTSIATGAIASGITRTINIGTNGAAGSTTNITLGSSSGSGSITAANPLTVTTINKVTITAPAAAATITIANNKTFTVNNTLSFSGSDTSNPVLFGNGGTVLYDGGALGTPTSGSVVNCTLPTASASVLGAIKIGSGLSIDGSGVVTAASGQVPTAVKTAAYTAAINEIVRVNTTSGAVNITLPASPTDGGIVSILDVAGTFGTNSVTVLPNGNKVENDATSLTLDIKNTYASFMYNSSTTNWRLLQTPMVGGGGGSTSITLFATTTTATTTTMTTDGLAATSSNQVVLPNDSTYTFSMLIVARRTDVDNESAGFKIEGVIDRNTSAASTALVGTIIKTIFAKDTSVWDCNVTADTTVGGISVTVTGEASKSISWSATINTTKITG